MISYSHISQTHQPAQTLSPPSQRSLQGTNVRLLDPPHVPHEQAPVGAERRGHLDHLGLAHVLPLVAAALGLEAGDVAARKGGHAPLDAEVARREDVHALEPEAGKHLDAPPAEAPHRHEPPQDVLVGGVGEPLGRQLAGRELARQALRVLGLALRQPRAPQRLDAGGGDLARRGEPPPGGGGGGGGGILARDCVCVCACVCACVVVMVE